MVFRMTYWGALFKHIYILPIYSPIIPSMSISIPPIKRMTHISELYPSGADGLTIFLTKTNTAYINPATAVKAPINVAILSGFTENDVKPLSQSDMSFFNE